MIETKTYSQVVGKNSFSLPFSDEDLKRKIREAYDHIIVLDDDPTGTQTVHDIPVLTSWSSSVILSELERGTKLFYILTNSRSLTAESAKTLAISIATNIQSACNHSKSSCLIISRSDSTLRGHYPLEVNVLIDIFHPTKAIHFIVPAFFEGGRFSKDDIHYVREGDLMIPAGNTSFSKDKVFGYASSNLKEWVVEKSDGKIDFSNIHSLSIKALETKSSDELSKIIDAFQKNDICIINATEYSHLKMAIQAILSSKVNPYFRSAASLIAAFTLQSPQILDVQMLHLNPSKGGLIVLGSYVPKSTEQLSHLLNNSNIQQIEIDVELLLENKQSDSFNISRKIDTHIQEGKDVILYTSRKLISSEGANSNLSIGNKVSNYLTSIVSGLSIAPNFVIGKGGITSSDIATESLNIKRAIILGQMIPGVPVWQTQRDSKFPNIPFIVFPGNVGDESALTRVYEKLRNQIRK